MPCATKYHEDYTLSSLKLADHCIFHYKLDGHSISIDVVTEFFGIDGFSVLDWVASNYYYSYILYVNRFSYTPTTCTIKRGKRSINVFCIVRRRRSPFGGGHISSSLSRTETSETATARRTSQNPHKSKPNMNDLTKRIWLISM